METGGGGTLDWSVEPAPSGGAVDLTAEGTLDWAHWGRGSAAAFNHKAGVTQQISNYSVVGDGIFNSYSDLPYQHTWTDGTPAQSVATTTGVSYSGAVRNGFQITVPRTPESAP